MSYANLYAENVAQARRQLQWAEQNLQRFKDAGTVVCGTIVRKGMEDYVGWLCKGGPESPADKAFGVWARCKGDVTHWERLYENEVARVSKQPERCHDCEETARLMQKDYPELTEEQREEVRGWHAEVAALVAAKSDPSPARRHRLDPIEAGRITEEEKAEALQRLAEQAAQLKGREAAHG